MRDAAQQLAQRLRDAGMRVTAPRLAVLAALSATDRHPEVEAIKSAASDRIGSISTQAVYDVLDAFVEAGLARRLRLNGGPARFEARTGDNHHHLVCRGCGSTVDIDCVVGAAPCLEPAMNTGFVVDEAEVIYWGRCPECVAATSVSSGEVRRTRSVRHSLGDTALDPQQPRQARSRASSHQQGSPREEKDRRD